MIRITYYKPEVVEMTKKNYNKFIKRLKENREFNEPNWYDTLEENIIEERESNWVECLVDIFVEKYDIDIKKSGTGDSVVKIEEIK